MQVNCYVCGAEIQLYKKAKLGKLYACKDCREAKSMTPLQRKTVEVLAQVPISERGICGYAKDGRFYQIEREEDSSQFYISVEEDNGSLSYDGFWPSSFETEYHTLEEAVREALVGAGIVQE